MKPADEKIFPNPPARGLVWQAAAGALRAGALPPKKPHAK
jgi:hypothetical protein